jgi:hypothetical protein
MSGPEFAFLILGLAASGAAGYGLRAHRSHLRRQRYRTSSAYHIHGAHDAATAPEENDTGPKASD